MWLWRNWCLCRIQLWRLLRTTHRCRLTYPPNQMWTRTVRVPTDRRAMMTRTRLPQRIAFRRLLRSTLGRRSLLGIGCRICGCLTIALMGWPMGHGGSGTRRTGRSIHSLHRAVCTRPPLRPTFRDGRPSQAPYQRHLGDDDDVGTSPQQPRNRGNGRRDMCTATHRDHHWSFDNREADDDDGGYVTMGGPIKSPSNIECF